MRIAIAAFALACGLPAAADDAPEGAPATDGATDDAACEAPAEGAPPLFESSISPRFPGGEVDVALRIYEGGAWEARDASGCLSEAQRGELKAAIEAATFGSVEGPVIRCMAMPVVTNHLTSPLMERAFSWGTPCGVPPHPTLVALGELAESMTVEAK